MRNIASSASLAAGLPPAMDPYTVYADGPSNLGWSAELFNDCCCRFHDYASCGDIRYDVKIFCSDIKNRLRSGKSLRIESCFTNGSKPL